MTRRDRGIRVAPAVVAAVALCALALLILLRDRFPTADATDAVVLRQDVVAATAGGWLVRVEVENQGREPVARLYVVGELAADGRTVETAEAVIDYIPPGVRRTATLFFRNDPAPLRLSLRAHGPEGG